MLNRFLVLLIAVALPCCVHAQNSTRKIRVRPSTLASQIGSAVNWENDVESAIKKSKATQKPVFWYVPTIPGSFMDRKPEVDRYMLAGPFSWPETIALLNKHFVPVKAVPNQQQQQKYGLVRYQFIEPGFVILADDASLQAKVDRITTLQPTWFQKVLSRFATHTSVRPTELSELDQQFADRDYEACLTTAMSLTENSIDVAIEADLQRGMALFRLGRQNDAKLVWRSIAERYPKHPTAWKAAAEAEGFGPFVRGFEVRSSLPAGDRYEKLNLRGTEVAQDVFSENDLWQNGTHFLLGMQDQNGGFTDSDYDFGGTDSLPNVHVAVTSLAGMALLKSLNRSEIDAKKLTGAVIRAAEFVANKKNINTADSDEILWAYAFRLRFLVRLAQTDIAFPSLQQKINTAVQTLQDVQSSRGSWYHEYANPFVTATALAALSEAKQAGFTVSEDVISKGVAALSSERMKNGAYPYSSSREAASKTEGTDLNLSAAAGRMPICELGLWYWGKSSDRALNQAVRTSLDRHDNLNKALKYDDHTSTLAYGGFFFWYDMRSRSEAISQIKDADLRAEYQRRQRQLIMALPEIDGCFVDSHELGRVYGTSMALLSLAGCEQE